MHEIPFTAMRELPTHSADSMQQAHSTNPASGKRVALAIGLLVLCYVAAMAFGWPQHGTEMVRHPAHHEGAAPQILAPPVLLVAPFVVLLGCIAILPLLSKTEHWWEKNRNRFLVATVLGLVTLLYFLFWHGGNVDGHWPAHWVAHPRAGFALQWDLAWAVFSNAILYEYIPFIVLLFSLYVISGGIRIEGNLAAHPTTNASFIAIGGALASFIGTTGAAMLLIRPLLETNRERKHIVHTVIFFIFVVCNCGGLLLPIGDPPLFLGYLRGVPFFWTMNLWPAWLAVNVLLLAIYLVWDHIRYRQERPQDIRADESHTRKITITGWKLNVPLLIGVVACVAFLDPSKAVPGTHWHAPLYLREMLQLALVGLSLWWGAAAIRVKNRFSYHAILEVAALFFGIFLCMQPALQILNLQGAELGVDTPHEFFWFTGGLSAVLDNAPTYVVFFETAITVGADENFVTVTGGRIAYASLVAISLGSVFMGAMTYIGNGPNFMVKAIAETSGVRMPSFFGYMKYSIVVMLPVLLVVSSVYFYLT